MEKKETIAALSDDLRSVKMGLLKLSYTIVRHGKTVTDGKNEIPVTDFEQQLLSSVTAVRDDVRQRGMETDILLYNNASGESFRPQLVYLDSIKDGLEKITEATKNDKASVTWGGETLSLHECLQKLIANTSFVEKGLKSEASKIGTKLNNKCNRLLGQSVVTVVDKIC